MKENSTLVLSYRDELTCISFDLKGKSFLTVTEEGMKFHPDNFPKWKLDDFTKEFMNILEDSWDIKFIKKTNEGE